MQSPELRDLRQNLAALLRQQAELGGHLGPRFPDMIDLNSEDRAGQVAPSTHGSRASSRPRKKDSDRAAAAEKSLTTELDRLRGEGGDNASANVMLHQLQDDLDAKRSLYESYLEAGQGDR